MGLGPPGGVACHLAQLGRLGFGNPPAPVPALHEIGRAEVQAVAAARAEQPQGHPVGSRIDLLGVLPGRFSAGEQQAARRAAEDRPVPHLRAFAELFRLSAGPQSQNLETLLSAAVLDIVPLENGGSRPVGTEGRPLVLEGVPRGDPEERLRARAGRDRHLPADFVEPHLVRVLGENERVRYRRRGPAGEELHARDMSRQGGAAFRPVEPFETHRGRDGALGLDPHFVVGGGLGGAAGLVHDVQPADTLRSGHSSTVQPHFPYRRRARSQVVPGARHAHDDGVALAGDLDRLLRRRLPGAAPKVDVAARGRFRVQTQPTDRAFAPPQRGGLGLGGELPALAVDHPHGAGVPQPPRGEGHAERHGVRPVRLDALGAVHHDPYPLAVGGGGRPRFRPDEAFRRAEGSLRRAQFDAQPRVAQFVFAGVDAEQRPGGRDVAPRPGQRAPGGHVNEFDRPRKLRSRGRRLVEHEQDLDVSLAGSRPRAVNDRAEAFGSVYVPHAGIGRQRIRRRPGFPQEAVCLRQRRAMQEREQAQTQDERQPTSRSRLH